MTLLLREIVRFLVGAGVWIVALLCVTGGVAAATLYAVDRRVGRSDVGLAIVAGGALAALAHRIGVGLLWAPRVAGRDLPVVWAAIGALAAAVAVIAMRRRHAAP